MNSLSSAPPSKNITKLNFTLKSENASYDFSISNKDEELTLKFEDLQEFPVKIYELKIEFEKLKKLDENFYMFKRADRLVKTIKSCIQNEHYSITFDKDENVIIFEIKNDLFDDGGAKLKIPEKEQDLKTQVEALTKTVSEMKKEIQKLKIKETEKEEAAVKSFEQTSFLTNDDKKLISKWIHPNKIIRFNMLFNTAKDGDSSSTFHYYCDGVFPTVTVVLDTKGNKFGGYSTTSWSQSTVGASNSRAPGSFIFDLSNQKKYELSNNFNANAVYRHNSYGPVFGGGYDLYIASSGKSNTNNYCNKNAYNTGNNNLLGNGGQTNFQVSNYEVYQVIFE